MQDRIILDNVSIRYRLPEERFHTMKEFAIRYLQRRLHYVDFWALRNFNLQVRKGESLGIIGANGAGKSTLLKVISHVLHPTEGRAWTCGRIAPLLELGAGFHNELTGRENIYLNGAMLGFSRKEMEHRFERIVDFAGLWDFIDVPIRTYSTGMVGRLGFSIASDANPDILLIDEILSVGDYEFAIKAKERISEFCSKDIAIILVTHALERMKEMCNRAIWLDHGRIAGEGDPKSVVEMYRASIKT
jgi:ABC-2 type transport system ATP-binding protein/lipopolysaccharide transport system ATP-binding protein